MAINPDALATGFEERMSTFSQEIRALNHVGIVVMEILVYDMQPRVCVCVCAMLWLVPWEGAFMV